MVTGVYTSPPRYMPLFLVAHWVQHSHTARRFSSNVANSRSRASRYTYIQHTYHTRYDIYDNNRHPPHQQVSVTIPQNKRSTHKKKMVVLGRPRRVTRCLCSPRDGKIQLGKRRPRGYGRYRYHRIPGYTTSSNIYSVRLLQYISMTWSASSVSRAAS